MTGGGEGSHTDERTSEDDEEEDDENDDEENEEKVGREKEDWDEGAGEKMVGRSRRNPTKSWCRTRVNIAIAVETACGGGGRETSKRRYQVLLGRNPAGSAEKASTPLTSRAFCSTSENMLPVWHPGCTVICAPTCHDTRSRQPAVGRTRGIASDP